MSDINRFVNLVRQVEGLPVDMGEYEPGDMVVGDKGAILVKVCGDNKYELYDGAITFYHYGNEFTMHGTYWGIQLFANGLGWDDVRNTLRGLLAWEKELV